MPLTYLEGRSQLQADNTLFFFFNLKKYPWVWDKLSQEH